jgi:excisionase family DNA binding protein
MKDEYVTVADAAYYLKTPKQTIRRFLREGRLEGEKHAVTSRWRVRMDSVRAMLPSGKIWEPAGESLTRRFANEMDYLRSLR